MQKLLIADCNEDFRLALAAELQPHYQVLTCRTGKEALSLLRRETPEILVLDLMLPELDGITVLERSAAQNIHPTVLVATSLLTVYVLERAKDLNIGYCMLKPCEIRAVAERLRDLCGDPKSRPATPDLRVLVAQRLVDFGLLPKHRGFDYLVEAIPLVVRNPAVSITKELYPAIAKACGCDASVERPIRMALEYAWAHGDGQLWQEYFPNNISRPSNADFIKRIARELRNTLE